LPYKQFDLYSGGWLGGSNLSEENVNIAGIELLETYIMVLLMVFALIPLLINRNRAMTIISLVMATFNVLYLPVLAFILTFELFSPRRNLSLELGYMIAVIAVLVFFGASIVELRKAIKAHRNRKPKPSVDLLDDL
jgi:hypothetical protein